MPNFSYELQAAYNKADFQTYPGFREKYTFLSVASPAFTDAGVKWALSCSSAMFFRGMIETFNDFDILFSEDDTIRGKEVLESIGVVLNPKTPQKDNYFCSPDYQQAKFGSVELDLITNISLKTFGGLYTYRVEDGVEMNSLDGNIPLPLIPIEAQMVLYGMMEGWQAKRLIKRDACYRYLVEMKKSQSPLRYHKILEDALTQEIPPFLREVINSLLK